MKIIRYLSLLLMLICGITARAQDDFNPTNPSEPGPMTAKLILLADPEEGGSVSGGGNIVPGKTVTLYASASSGFTFVNWTDAAGNEISTTRSFNYVKKDGTETLIAHFVFTPNNPNEPGQLPSRLTLVAEEGGSVSGGGFYKEGAIANIYATANSNYEFVGWYYADGSLYSNVANTTFTMIDHALTLTARFVFNPDSPVEPSAINTKHRLTLVAEEGGTVSADSYRLDENQSTTVRATANTGYVFAGWYNGDELVSETEVFTFTMGTTNVTLVAHFNFMPNSPNEPGEIKQRTFTITLYNVVTKPGVTAQFPILLTPRVTMTDMTIQINFSTELNVDFSNIVVGETTEPYQMSYKDLDVEDGLHGYKFDLTGGKIEGGNVVVPILTFPIIIPADAETATSHQIKINQISMTHEDGTTETAGTRNGRISIFKNGDSNGDNVVDLNDKANVIAKLRGQNPEVFIEEVSNVNDDGKLNISDAMGIVEIINGEQ